ncbi:MAG: Lon protease family protein, partial [Anaerolineae bacterium]
AVRAIEFGLEIPSPGYNIYAMGPAGSGKTSIITRFLERKAASRPVPPDWGYVHNFSEPDRPRAVRLPPGGGVKVREQVDTLLAQVHESLKKSFASDQYLEHRGLLERALDEQRNERFRELDRTVRAQGFALVRTPVSLMIAPAKEGQPLTQEQYQVLSESEQQSLEQEGRELQDDLERTLRQVRELEEAAQQRLDNLDQEIAGAAVGPFFARLSQEYADWPDVVSYLTGIEAHIVAHSAELRRIEDGEREGGQAEAQPPPLFQRANPSSPRDQYVLNVVVDNSALSGAPVVLETNPTLANLAGRVEQRAEFGTLVTDHRLVKAGALQRANGGYLLLDARTLLRQPMAWDALKQALRSARVRIENAEQRLGVFATTTLEPEPIPLDVKVVLIGDPNTYYSLYALDEQYEKLFKVRADFAVEMGWSSENEEQMMRFIGRLCTEEALPHFDLSAVCKVIEHSSRLVEDQRKLTTRFAYVTDIVHEAAYWAREASHSEVTAEDVSRAIAERIYRSNQVEERMREMILDGAIKVDLTNEVIGQVNGLAIISLGDYEFGRPTRITARTHLGRAGVINIEREAKLSGRIHDKGMLILAGFLGGRYAQHKPLSLSASIAFEQSYDGVDGDSAASTELYALLSSLAELPIQQGIAVTGSVNQFGEIQAIGGASAKVEGFFDVCRLSEGGLTGNQGVILPDTNVPTLMVREDVVAAVEAGRFHIYPVKSVDEGVAILTGLPAGERDKEGDYPIDTVNGRVDRKLRELALRLQEFGKPAPPSGGEAPARTETDESAEGTEREPPEPPTLPGDSPQIPS